MIPRSIPLVALAVIAVVVVAVCAAPPTPAAPKKTAARLQLEADDQYKFGILKEWTVANGGWVSHKLGLETLPEFGGHGLRALKEMAREESYVCVPYRIALSQSTLNISGLCEPCFRLQTAMNKVWHIKPPKDGGRVHDVDSSSIILGLFMALQRFHLDAFWPVGGPFDEPQQMIPATDSLPYHRSFWQPQIQMLPASCTNGATLALHPELVKLMEGSPSIAYLEDVRDAILAAWKNVKRLKLRVPLTFEQFVWGVCQYRSHYEFVEDTYESAMVPIDDMTNFDPRSWLAPGADFIEGGFEFAKYEDEDEEDELELAAHHPQNKCWLRYYDPFIRSDASFGKCKLRETPKTIAMRMRHFNEGVGADENRVGLLVFPPEIPENMSAPSSFYGAHARFAPQGDDLKYAIEQLHKNDIEEAIAERERDEMRDDDDDDDDDEETEAEYQAKVEAAKKAGRSIPIRQPPRTTKPDATGRRISDSGGTINPMLHPSSARARALQDGKKDDDDDDDEIDDEPINWADVRELEREQHRFSTRVWYGSWCVYTNVPHAAGQPILCDYNWHRNIGTLVQVGYIVINSTRDLLCFPFSWDDTTVVRRVLEDNWAPYKDDFLFFHPDRHSDRYDTICVRRIDGHLSPQSLGLVRVAMTPGAELSAYTVGGQLSRYNEPAFMAKPLSVENEHDVAAFAYETCAYYARLYPGNDKIDRGVVRVLTKLMETTGTPLSGKDYMTMLIHQQRIEERDTLRNCLKHYTPTKDPTSPYETVAYQTSSRGRSKRDKHIFTKLRVKPAIAAERKAIAKAKRDAAVKAVGELSADRQKRWRRRQRRHKSPKPGANRRPGYNGKTSASVKEKKVTKKKMKSAKGGKPKKGNGKRRTGAKPKAKHASKPKSKGKVKAKVTKPVKAPAPAAAKAKAKVASPPTPPGAAAAAAAKSKTTPPAAAAAAATAPASASKTASEKAAAAAAAAQAALNELRKNTAASHTKTGTPAPPPK